MHEAEATETFVCQVHTIAGAGGPAAGEKSFCKQDNDQDYQDKRC